MHAAILQQALSNWYADLFFHSAHGKNSEQCWRLDGEKMIWVTQLRMIKNMRLAFKLVFEKQSA